MALGIDCRLLSFFSSSVRISKQILLPLYHVNVRYLHTHTHTLQTQYALIVPHYSYNLRLALTSATTIHFCSRKWDEISRSRSKWHFFRSHAEKRLPFPSRRPSISIFTVFFHPSLLLLAIFVNCLPTYVHVVQGSYLGTCAFTISLGKNPL